MEALLVNSGIYTCLIIIMSMLLFLVMQLKKDNSLIDIAYGPLFFCGAVGTLLLTSNRASLPLIITGLFALWGIRLAIRIGRKNWRQPEDIRYKTWREAWLKKGTLYFVLRSLLQINLLQAIIIGLVALPFVISISSTGTLSIPFLLLGGLVFLVGFIIETVADWQIDRFIKRKKTDPDTPTLLTTGLFAYSRRPNYFGETLIWWGIAIMVLPLPYGYLGLISPILITYIVTAITGPMLEKIFSERYGTDYAEYKKHTSYFIPLPRRK